MELRSGKTLIKRTEKESDNDPEKDVQTLLDGYAVGGIEGEERISPRKTELVDTTHLQPSPPPAIDISSVRYRRTLVMTSADLTSSRGPSWPKSLRSGKFINNIMTYNHQTMDNSSYVNFFCLAHNCAISIQTV